MRSRNIESDINIAVSDRLSDSSVFMSRPLAMYRFADDSRFSTVSELKRSRISLRLIPSRVRNAVIM